MCAAISLAAALSNQLYLDRTLAYDIEFEKRIAALTPQQLVEAMRKYVDPSKITIVKAGDFTKTGK
jgi:zinc protease